MRGPPFSLRGIVGHDSRSPCLSLSLIVSVTAWDEPPPSAGVPELGASKSPASVRVRSRTQGRGKGAGGPGEAVSWELGARLIAAIGAAGESRGAELSVSALPSLGFFSAAPPSRGAWGPPICALAALGGGGRLASWFRQLSPTSCGKLGFEVPTLFLHRTPSTLRFLSVFLDVSLPLFLPLFTSFSVQRRLSFCSCVSVSLSFCPSDYGFWIPSAPRRVSVCLSFCFSLSFLG